MTSADTWVSRLQFLNRVIQRETAHLQITNKRLFARPFISERLQLIPSADDWFAMRQLRNQMVHEYIEDPRTLANALQMGHEFVATLIATTEKFANELTRRHWLADE